MSMSVFPGERPDRMEEECGVFGIYAPGEDVARMTCFGLQALRTVGRNLPALPLAMVPPSWLPRIWAW